MLPIILHPAVLDIAATLGIDHQRLSPALDHLTVVVDQNQIGHPDVAEVHAEGVDPEVVQALGIPGCDVASDALVEAELGEEPEPGGQALLPVGPMIRFGEPGRAGSVTPVLRPRPIGSKPVSASPKT